MSRLNEITSTEKLLDIIRNKRIDSGTGSVDPSKIDPPKSRFKFTIPEIVPVRKSINIGIDIGHEYLRMVKTKHLPDNQWELLNYKTLPLVYPKNSPEFINFLRSEINEFCGSYKNTNIWAIMSAARVNVRHINIPKVPKKQIENAVYWTIKKETPFDEKESVFDFEIQREVSEQGVPKWLTMVYTAPRETIEEIKGLFNQIGLPLTGISITPFAVQNIFKTGWIVPAIEGTVASLFIGNNFCRIDIYTQGKLIMTRGIKAGVSSMVESLAERLMETRRESSEKDRKLSLVTMEQARKVLFSLSPDSQPLTKEDVGFELTDDEKFNAILPALERMIRQVERSFEHFTVSFKFEKVSKIYVSSAMNISKPIIEYIGDQLGIESDVIDALKLKLPREKSIEETSFSERLALTPAFGIALSDNTYTPNLLFRYKDKENAANIIRLNRIIFAVFIVAVLITSGIFLLQIHSARQKEAQIAILEKELLQFTPRIDQNMVSQMIASSRKQQGTAKEYSDQYTGMAVISELSLLTPTNIRLTNLNAHFGIASSGKMAAKESQKETIKDESRHVMLEGIIFGDRKTLESSLAGYIMKLDASPMFHQISIQKNVIEPFKKGEVLYFIIDIKVG
ncbi:MAG: pilus assembly protein PilM [Syntrophaceae bacterium]